MGDTAPAAEAAPATDPADTNTSDAPVEAPETAAPETEAPATEPAAETPATEPEAPAAEAKPEPEPENPRIGRAFAELTKREAALRAKEQGIKTREAQVSKLAELQSKIDANPLTILELYPDLYEKLTTAILQQGEPAPEPTVEDKVKQLEERLAAKEKAEAEARKAAEQADIERKIESAKQSLTRTAESDPERWELVNAEGAHETAWEVIEAYWSQHQKVLPYETALDQVEDHLVNERAKLLSLKKIRARLAPAAPAAKPAAAPAPGAKPAAPAAAKPATATLTNNSFSEAPVLEGEWPKDEDASRKKAASLLRFVD